MRACCRHQHLPPDAPRRLSAVDGRCLFPGLRPVRRNGTASAASNSAVIVPRNRSTLPRHITGAIYRAEHDLLRIMRPLLGQIRPGAGWVENELDDGPRPDGRAAGPESSG